MGCGGAFLGGVFDNGVIALDGMVKPEMGICRGAFGNPVLGPRVPGGPKLSLFFLSFESETDGLFFVFSSPCPTSHVF